MPPMMIRVGTLSGSTSLAVPRAFREIASTLAPSLCRTTVE